MNTSKLLTVVIGLQILTLAGQYLGQPTLVAPAQAQMPDSGGQRAQMIEELKGIHSDIKTMAASVALMAGRVDKMATIMDSGSLQVRVASSDENKRPAGR